MKNLLLLQHRQQAPNADTSGAQLLTIDQNKRHTAYVVNDKHIVRIDNELDQSEIVHTLEATTVVVAIEHLALNDELCLATESGDVIVLNLATGETESVGYCAGGISQMAWSPDQEVVAFVTREGVLVVMDSLYSPVSECVLSESGFGDGAFVNVGWGAKETQFHGSAGKAARHVKTDHGVDLDGEHLDKATAIVWRGDSELFAVSFYGEKGREFKVFDKEGSLKFTSEATAGLGVPICWRPSGTWIAIPQTLSNKYVIALFEKNGLRHREIVLPFTSQAEPIVRIEFSEDSDVLAIQTWNVAKSMSCIYLYTICNYHWYQKQTLYFDSNVNAFSWQPCCTVTKQLHVLTDDGAFRVFRWDFAVATSKTFDDDDQAVVAVIDGTKVLLTAFRGAVVPPPMCSHELSIDVAANWVEFLQHPELPECANQFLVVDAHHNLTTYSTQFKNGLLTSVKPVMEFSLESNHIPLTYTHWMWLNPDTVIAVCTASSAGSQIHVCKMDNKQIKIVDSSSVAGLVSRMCAVSANEIQVVTSIDSYRLSLNSFSTAKSLNTSYSDLVENICTTKSLRRIGEYESFALKHRHWLYHDDKVIATEVTSMFLTESYLVFTKLDRLFFVRLADGQIVGERRLERGSRLIVVVPKDCRTVLQMPRGNLEVIQPRVLSLCIIGKFLDAREYYKAFDLMRKQRINLNLLVDHNSQTFYENTMSFVQSIQNPNWLNLFLSDLEETDVTVTMYSSNYPGRKSTLYTKSKVSDVCVLIVAAINQLNAVDQLTLPILTSYVKRKELDEALNFVWRMKVNYAIMPPRNKDHVTAAAALNYLLYLVNVNELYNVALGTYNFELVKFVAAKSQKDPREYLPFLDGLRQIENVDYRMYRIDLYLKRYEKALEHIVLCGTNRLDEALQLVVDQSLYRKALDLYAAREDTKECYTKVAHKYAEYLRENGRLRECCLMYERCGDFAQALLSYRHILDWQKCISVAVALKQTPAEIEHLVRSLIPALLENGKYQEAADMIVKFQTDFDAAIPILCDGKLYAEALYLARVHAEHLIEPVIKPHLLAHAVNLTQSLNDDLFLFLEYKTRLLDIRKEKQDRKAAALVHENSLAVDNDADMFSDTSSMNSSRYSASSRGTAKTHRSSKNRRKHQRKLLSLKTGNAFEDIALIDALHAATAKAFDQQTSVRAVCKALIDLRRDADAIPVQTALKQLIATINESLDEIWIPEMIVSGQTITAEEGPIDFTQMQEQQHYAMIQPHQRYKPQHKPIDWEFAILETY